MNAGTHRLLSFCTALALGCGLSSPAAAFTVKSGFTDGCHEKITLAAYLQARAPLPNFDAVPVPDGPWEEVADYLLADAQIKPATRQEKFILFSLLAGVRAPDNEGFSITSLTALRAVQANPEGQYDHCLRAGWDDYLDGNVATLEGCRESIYKELRKASDFLDEPMDDQVVEVNFTLDFYGTFEVEVWGVAYHVGRSVHPFEDSFTHTLRTADLRKVIHFMNYVEAIEDELEEERDGMPHSSATDVCYLTSEDPQHPGNAERTFATLDGTADLFRAISTVLNDDPEGEKNVQVALDKWLTYAEGSELGYEEGCIKDNDYCDSQWLAQARLSPSGPIFCSVIAAGSRSAHPGASTVFGGLLAVAVARVLRRRR